MGITKDALELLVKLYNDKINGVAFDIDNVFIGTGFSKTRFMNAYDYLRDRGLIHRGFSVMGETKTGLPNVSDVTISSLGIDAIEKEDILKNNFGEFKIEINQKGQVNIVSQSGDKSVSNINATSVEKPTYQNVGEITYGPKYQNVSGSITYDGDVENVFLLKKTSIFFINLLGEKNVKNIGWISTILGIIDIFGWILSITNKIIPMTYNEYTSYVVGFGFLLVVIGLLFLKMHTYKNKSKCPKCNKDYAMEEYKDPIVKEIETSEGLRKTTTRFYKCKYCGYEETGVEKE